MESSTVDRPDVYPTSPTYQYDQGYRPLHEYASDHGQSSCSKQQNVGEFERYASAAAGAALAVSGLARGKFGGWILAALGGSLLYRGVSGHCTMYQQLGIDTHRSKPSTAVPAKRGVKVEKSLTVNQPVEMLYAFWRDLSNLPTVMTHLKSVEQIDDKRSRWVAEAPLGQTVHWDAEIINERENEMIAWRSIGDSQVDTAGSVHFKPIGHDRGTAVTVSLKYDPPAGKLGIGLAYLFGDNAERQIDEDLRRFKQMMETGELPTAAVKLAEAHASGEAS
jgi:uncharacterized membrane protein